MDIKSDRRELLRVSGGALAAGLSTGLGGCLGGIGAPGEGGIDPSPDELTDQELMDEASPPDEIVMTDFPVPTPMYYALEKGFFEARGLNVSLTPQSINGGSRNVQAVLAGNADVAANVSTASPVKLAHQQDQYLHMVHGVHYDGDPYVGMNFLVGQEGTVSEVSDLEGETVAMHQGGTGVVPASVKRLVEQAGLDPATDVTFRVLPLPDIVGAVANGEVAAGHVLEPAALRAEAEDLGVTRITPAMGWLYPGNVAGYWVPAAFTQENPYTVELLRRSLGEAYAVAGSSEWITVTAANVPWSESLLERAWDEGYAHAPIAEFGETNPLRSLEKQRDLLVTYSEDLDEMDVEPSRLLPPWDREE